MASDYAELQAALPQRYTLLRELDRGGMSHVYLARESLPDRDVAIKVFARELSAHLGRERFVREVEVTSQLGHPHIVSIHAAGEADGHLYYVMPFIAGESLRDRLEREGRLPIEEALRIAQEVAGALAHAHGRGIVHRDIKPANILFQSGHAVVADFGIARAIFAADDGTRLTGSGHILGTPDYMSPEQISSDGTVDERTDQYALACVLYEMLGGQPPFHSRTAQATLARHLTDGVPSLTALRGGVSEGLEQVVGKALSKAPADRYPSIVRLADEIRRGGRSSAPAPVESAPTGLLGPLKVSLQVAGVLLVVAMLGVAHSAWFGRDQAIALSGAPFADSVAMMPLENATGDASMDHVGKSITGRVVDHLQRVPRLKVIGEYSVRSLWEQDLGHARLMDTLGVGHLLEGWIELRGNQMAIGVTDTDPNGVVDETHFFDFPRDALDSAIVAVAHEIAGSFLARNDIAPSVHNDEEVSVGARSYLLANEFLGNRSRAGMVRAEELLLEAIEADAGFAPAHAALSSVYALSLSYRYDLAHDPFDVAAAALTYADRAIALDSTLSDGYASRGYAQILLDIDVDAAQADFDTALRLAPNEPSGASWSSRVLARRGETDEALAAAARARDADRLQAGRHMALAALELQVGRYRDAARSARVAYGIQPRLYRAAAREALALLLMGRPNECLQVELGPYELIHASCHFAAGNPGAADSIIAEAEVSFRVGEAGGDEYLEDLVAAELASYYALTGDPVAAASWTRRAFEESPVGVDPRILESELFSAVRDDPGFAAALEESRTAAREEVVERWRSHPLAMSPES